MQGTASSPPSTATANEYIQPVQLPFRAVIIGSMLVDFDGTACPQDVSEELLERFGQGDWRAFDDAVDRGEVGLRAAAEAQAAMLAAPVEEMLAYALEHYQLDPSFEPFAGWLEASGTPVAVVSDGFAFYIRPLLERAGLGHLPVITNEYDGVTLSHPNGHPVCVGCGTCKMRAATTFRERYGSVGFVGEGQSDRYGALYSDVVFATKDLVRICKEDGVPYLEWQTFDDVRGALESLTELPGAVGPERCPGWRFASTGAG